MSPCYYEHASLAGFLQWAGELGPPPMDDLDVSAFAGSTRCSNFLIERIVRDRSLELAAQGLGDHVVELVARLENVTRWVDAHSPRLAAVVA